MNSTNRLRAAMTLGVSAAALLIGAPAWAQTATPAAPSASEGVQVGEVVVTAQRREARLQDVPLAVTAANADTLAAAKVDNVSNIKALSPSISFNQTNTAAASANIQIRSIGTVGNSRTFEGAVGVFVDGVYRTRSGQALQNFLDIDSVQVLRGPQGTLFGKNTSAGAVLIASARPNMDGVSGTYEATYGNYNTSLVRGAVNLPVNDKLAFRIAAIVNDNEGFIKNPDTGEDYNDRHAKGIKAQMLYQPTDDLSIRLIVDYAKEQENCCYGTVNVVNGPTQPLIDAFTVANGLTPTSSNWRNYEQTLNQNTDQRITDQGAVLQVNWQTPLGGELNSITAYRDWKFSQGGMDADFSGADILNLNESFRSKFFSQEVTYGGKFEDVGFMKSIDYIVGAFYSKEDILAQRDASWGTQAQAFWNVAFGGPVAVAPAGLYSTEYMPASGKSYALFTQGTFNVTDQFSVIAGLRWSREEKTGAFTGVFDPGNARNPFRLLPVAGVAAPGVYPGPDYSAEHTDEAFSGTFGLQYRFTPDIMGYATYSRGFKAGGVNIDANGGGTRGNNPAEVPGAVPLDPTFQPEFINGYELGLKMDYLDRRARTNIALFYNDLKDLQVAQFLGLRFTIINAPKATVYGLEIENTFRVNQAITLGAAATFIPKSEFSDAAILGILSGRRFSQSPKFSGNFSVNLDQPISDDFSIIGRAALQYQSRIYTNTATNSQQGGYGLVNLSLGVKQLSQGWSIEAFCQNCTDKRYITQHFSTPLQTGDENAYVGAPRTYGVTLRGKF